MDADAAAVTEMASNDNGEHHANGESLTMMDATLPSTVDETSSSSDAAAAAVLPAAAAALDRSASDGSVSQLELTLCKWDDKHHRPRNTVQRKSAERSDVGSAAVAAASSSELMDDALPEAAVLAFTSSSEWGTDEDENLRNSYFMHSEVVPPTSDGKGKASVRQKKIFMCMICSQRYKRNDRFLKHVQSHEVTAASMLEELQQQAAQHAAHSVQEAESGEEEPRFFVGAVQVVVQFRCKLCQPQITLYEQLGELNRHILVEHLGKVAPALLTSRPQHRKTLRVPVLRSFGGSNSDDENGGVGDDDDGCNDSPPVTQARTKHTPSRFGKNGGGAAASSSNGGRKRKSIASTTAGPDEDGCAVSHGVVCADCTMVFPSENDAYRKHRQGHLRFKSESSLAQQHMTDEQRAAHEAAHPEQQAAAAAAGGRVGLQPGLKPLTRAQLAAISKRSDDDQEKADKESDSDTPPRMRRNPASASSLVSQQQQSPPEQRVSCDGCQRIFSRRSALNRHLRSNKCKGTTETNGGRNCNSEDESSGGDGSDGEYNEHRKADPKLWYCKFCPHVCKSRTSMYTHRKKCSSNPEINGADAAAAGSSHGMDQLLAATGESMHDEALAKPLSKPPLHRQRSAEKSANGSRSLSRPAMQRSQTEPMGGAAAAPSHSPKGADRFAAKDLICPVCKETFTHPFSVNRHMSVHPDESYKGAVYSCKHCMARFGHSQRFHKHESTCASRLQGGHSNGHAASTKEFDEPETSPRAKRARKAASSSADTSTRVQSSASPAAETSIRSSSDPMLDHESSALGEANIDSSSLLSSATQAPEIDSALFTPVAAAAQAPMNLPQSTNQPSLSGPLMQLSSFAPSPERSTSLSEAPIPTLLPVASSAPAMQPFSFAPLRPTSQIGSFGSRAAGGASPLSSGFASLPPFPPTMSQSRPVQLQTQQPMTLSADNINRSAFLLSVQGVGLRSPATPSGAASVTTLVSASAPSPASLEVAMAATSTPQPCSDSDRSLVTGSSSPATAAFNQAKLQAASAPGKRAASLKKKVGYEATSVTASAAAKPSPAATAASASTVPASASASISSDSVTGSPAAAAAASATAIACPMCSASFISLSFADQRSHRRKCMDRLVRLSINQRSEKQKRLIEQERLWIKSLKTSDAAAVTNAQPKPKTTHSTSSVHSTLTPLQAGSEVPASASTSSQTRLPQSWSAATPTPPKLTSALQLSARQSLTAPTPSSPNAASAASASSSGPRQPPLPPLQPKLSSGGLSQLSPRVQTGHGTCAASQSSWLWAVKKAVQ